MSDLNVSLLEARIAALTEVYSSVQALRQIPSSLLKRHSALVPPRTVAEDFQQIKDVATVFRSEPIQAALADVENRIKTDPSSWDTNYRREIRKRRRPPSPDSPKPYTPAERTETTFWPELDGSPLVTFGGLVAYTREFNRAQDAAVRPPIPDVSTTPSKPCRLHIWERTKEQRQPRPRTMRFIVPDALIAYLTLNFAGADNTAFVSAITCFGPRERKAPHTQSDFAVFRLLTQEIAKMILSQDQVPLKSVTDLLLSYEGLFIDPCKGCGLVFSAEGHAPPVVRLCRSGQREVLHVTCVDQ